MAELHQCVKHEFIIIGIYNRVPNVMENISESISIITTKEQE